MSNLNYQKLKDIMHIYCHWGIGHMPQRRSKENFKSLFSLFTVWIPGIELWSSGEAVGGCIC